MIPAVLFDFDGVIVDSERLHWAAFNRALAPLGQTISWPDYVQTYIGFDDRDTFRHVCPQAGLQEWMDLMQKKAVAFQDLLKSNGAVALPGAVELIRSLSGRIPIAVCSGALREDILPILGSLGIEGAFDTIVTAHDTPLSKPDPAPYKLAVRNLGVVGGLAIEDTPAGIASAKGAGLKALAVTNSYSKEFLTQADAWVASLEALTLEKLREMF